VSVYAFPRVKDRPATLQAAVWRHLSQKGALMEEHRIHATPDESEAPFRAIADNLPAVVFQALLHQSGAVDLAYVSEGSHLVLGIGAEVLMSHPEMILDMILPEDRESFAATRLRLLRQPAALNWEGRIRFGTNEQAIKCVNLCTSARKLQLASHIERVKELERGHVAREIHDDLGGTLTAAKIDLAWIRSRLDPGQTALAEKTDALEGLLDSAIETTGRISRSLRPPVLDHGVVAAIEWQVKEFHKRMGIACDFICAREDIVLDQEYSTALFRIFQETLTNIAKHAGASHVDISLNDDGNEVLLTVIDDGRGIDANDMHKSGSYGIRGMRERAGFLGGTIDISGASGSGTQVRVRLPAKRPSFATES
jgi:signal transduction histidine kinase